MSRACLISFLLLLSFLLSPAGAKRLVACSEVMLQTTGMSGKDAVSARTVDYPSVEKADLRWKTIPRGMSWQSTAPGNVAGLCWQNPYGFVGLAFGGQEDSAKDPQNTGLYIDGLNEKGLSAAQLWLNEADYAHTAANTASSLYYQDLVPWVLGNYETTDQVKSALQQVTVWGVVEETDPYLPLHLVVHDANRNTLIVEWTQRNGVSVQQIYNGDATAGVGVLANSPPYPDQVEHLIAYEGLNDLNALEGLPGDTLSPSRFVRLAKLNAYGRTIDSSLGSVTQAFHLMNRVNVVNGEKRVTYPPDDPNPRWDYTGLTLVRDHANLTLWYRGYYNQTLRSIRFESLNFDRPADREGLPVDVNPDSSLRYGTGQDVSTMLNAPQSSLLWDEDAKVWRLTLSLTVQVPDERRGRLGRLFIFARTTDGRFYCMTPRGVWAPTGGSFLLPCRVGPLETATFREVVRDLPVPPFQGTRIFVGYGATQTDMFLQHTYGLAYVVGEKTVKE